LFRYRQFERLRDLFFSGETNKISPLEIRNQVRSSFGDWLNGILELSVSLEEMELDVSAFSCLAALSLLHGNFFQFLAKEI
jgi:hypothetical protein